MSCEAGTGQELGNVPVAEGSDNSVNGEGVEWNGVETPLKKKERKPRRVLHFSDGVLEEYSSDEEGPLHCVNVAEPNLAVADPAEMGWSRWAWLVTTSAVTKVLAACEYAGEVLANFFGITTPKYQYEYNEYQRMLEQEKRREEKLKEQMAGWGSAEDDPSTANSTLVTNSPMVSTEDIHVTAIGANTRKPDTRPKSNEWERY